METKPRHVRYLEIVRKMGQPLGDPSRGETKIIIDPKKIVEMEKSLQKSYQKKGLPREFGLLGVVFENPWYVFMNEPVYFGSTPGSYVRVLYKGDISGERSIFCLPTTRKGDFILTVSYRTTVRAWVIEAPGTATKEYESHSDALKRCVLEKLGFEKIIEFEMLYEQGIISERGLIGTSVPIYLVTLDERAVTVEPIDLNVNQVVTISPKKLEQGFLDGYIEIDGRNCLCRDAYTAFSLFILGLKS